MNTKRFMSHFIPKPPTMTTAMKQNLLLHELSHVASHQGHLNYMATLFQFKGNTLYLKEEACQEIVRPMGGSRRVFIVKSSPGVDGLLSIVKISKQGIQNKKEWERYQTIIVEDLQYFPTILGIAEHNGYNFLFEDYLKLGFGEVSTKEKRLVRSLAKKYNINDIVISDEVDDDSNWAINQKTNKPVIFDFGL